MTERQRRSWRTPIEVGLLAVLAYVPMLLSARGSVAADTKLYLYLDPSKLLADAALDVGHPPVRRMGAAPGRRLPVAGRALLLG